MDKYDLEKIKEYNTDWTYINLRGNEVHFSDSIDEDNEPMMMYYIAAVFKEDEHLTKEEVVSRLEEIRGYSLITTEIMYFLKTNRILIDSPDNCMTTGEKWNKYIDDINSCVTKKWKISIVKDAWSR
jgi:hypothetical protein